MFSHIHSQYIRVISTFWSGKTQFWSCYPGTAENHEGILAGCLHCQTSSAESFTESERLASGLQESRHPQVTLRTDVTHSTLLLVVACEKARQQSESQSPVPACGAGSWHVFFACSQSTALMEATERRRMVNLNAVCHFLALISQHVRAL